MRHFSVISLFDKCGHFYTSFQHYNQIICIGSPNGSVLRVFNGSMYMMFVCVYLYSVYFGSNCTCKNVLLKRIRQMLQRFHHCLQSNTDHWKTHTCSRYDSWSGRHLWTLPHILSWKMSWRSSLTPLDTSDHSLVSVKVDAKLKASPDRPFHRMIFQYMKAGWDSFSSYMLDTPITDFFKHTAPKTVALYQNESVLE